MQIGPSLSWTAAVHLSVDLTERKAAGGWLSEDRERQFRSVFSESADALLLLDDQGLIADVNGAAEKLFGAPRVSLAGRPADSLLTAGGEPLQTALREVLALGEARRELRFTDGSGGTRLIECSVRARVHGDFHLCVARDVTNRRLLEERVAQSEKIESVGRLAGGIAHDFNNLLTAILGYTELLLCQKGNDDPDRADLEEIQKAGTRAAALTQQLLAFSRKQVLQPKEVDLNQTVANLKAMLTRLIREDIQLICVPAGAPAVVRIDPTQIEQVILNLVLNARDALPGGGRIRVELALVPHHVVDLPADLAVIAAEYVRLVVRDDGVGIAPDALPHLFEPFFTTKEVGKGTGLGLASVHGIVHQSNGFITVESTLGAGATFTMHFPAVAPSTSSPGSQAAIQPAAGGQETVLLVEDEPAVRAMIATVLRRYGYQVLEAGTASIAIDIAERHTAEIDLLVTDVVMPEMNGPALAQRLVAAHPTLRILFISGYAERMLPLDNGNPNVGFLGKPFQASALATKVHEMLTRTP